jgi:hypothetical protein
MRRAASLAMLMILLELPQHQILAGPKGATPRKQIRVVLCDNTGLEERKRESAAAEVSRIMASASITIEWAHTCMPVAHPSYFTLIVLPTCPLDWPARSETMGRSVVLAGPYPRAYVFLDRVRLFDRLSAQSDAGSEAALLGHALAHELGHLLGQSHTPQGIMTAIWSFKEREEALGGVLLFQRAIPLR